MEKNDNRVLLTGASGFIGSALYPILAVRGYDVVCGSRNPKRAKKNYPKREWVKFDLHDRESIRNALKQVDYAYYLIHEMSEGKGYEERERKGAKAFQELADETDLKKIIYLGGVAPPDGIDPSAHLKSRIETGRVLRSGQTPTFELRASMVIGEDSASWKIVRDLSARLPAMILPAWTQSRTQPVYISDVTKALLETLETNHLEPGVYDIPGPDTLSVEEIFRHTARILYDNIPVSVRVPLLTPKLSSYWLRFVTRSDYSVASELVNGLKSDLLARDERFWSEINHQNRVGFVEAVSKTLRDEENLSLPARTYEKLISMSTRLTGTQDVA